WSIRTGGDAVESGHDYVQTAVANLKDAQPSNERDALLIDIAVLQVDLIPDQAEIDKAKNKNKAEQLKESAFRALERTFSLTTGAEARAEALLQVTHKLLAKKMGEQAQRLVGDGGGSRDELLAAFGLELCRAGHTQAGPEGERLVKAATALA